MSLLDTIMKNNYIDGFLRAYPILIIFYIVTNFLLHMNYINYFFLIFVFFNVLVNKFLKSIVFKSIMGNNYFPIIGIGKRPDNAMNCGLFKNNKKSTTYGMPSGHSQHAMAFPTFILLNKLTNNIHIILLFYLIGFVVMYSRVYFKCHTVQQVLLGGIVGCLNAYVITKYKYLFIN